MEISQIRTEKNRWGYWVCFGIIITFIAGIGHVNSSGLIFNDFIIETNSSAKSLMTANGLFAIMLACGGIILNILTKRVSLRLGGIVGAVLFAIGSFATVAITEMHQLCLTFGVIQGVGFGMMVPVCYATLNLYFNKKRTMAMSACKAAQGIIVMGYPQLITIFTNFYGFRGTLLILSAISLHPIAGMLTMRSPAWKNKTILNILNLKVLKDLAYCNICLGQSFVNSSDLTFFIMQPMLLFQYGYDRQQVATCISICAGADVVGRCVMVAVSGLFRVNTKLLFYFATLVTLIARIVIIQLRKFLWVCTGTAVLGLLRAWLHIASPLVISDHVSRADFPGAYALATLAAGLVNVVISPLLGFLKDSYQDYTPAFYALAACCAPCLVLWPLEHMLKKK